MGTLASRFRRRLHWYSILAIVSVCAVAGHTENQLQQETLRLTSNFEEDTSGTSARYIWRSLGTMVSLSCGGELSIRWSTGGLAHVSFAGANARSVPHGELSSGKKTIYYLGAVNDWRTASHFEPVRYSAIYPGIDLVFVVAGNQLEYDSRLPLRGFRCDSDRLRGIDPGPDA
jgi:hypothetical protein